MRRLTRRQKLEEQVKALDVFAKVEPDHNIEEKSGASGLVSIITGVIIVSLLVNEVIEYNTLKIHYEYGVDEDLRRDMNLTVDMTIAMSCEHLGADYVDASAVSINALESFTAEPAHFALAPNQQEFVDKWAKIKEEEGAKGLDSLNRFLHGAMRPAMPTASPRLTTPPDACRIHGTMALTKVAANFHITAGKSVQHKLGHSHVSNLVPAEAMNFTHRIDRFSFSEEPRGGMALDGDIKITQQPFQKYQYYIKVVPSTTLRLGETTPFRSNQYSVTEQPVVLKPHHKSLPGLFFKFEIAEIGVHVSEEHMPFSQFLIRVCGLVGGFFAFSKLLSVVMAMLFKSAQEQGHHIPS